MSGSGSGADLRGRLVRTRTRGRTAALVVLLLSLLGWVVAFYGYGSVPPGVVSLLVLGPLVLVGRCVIVEWRAPDARASATPVLASVMIGIAVLLGLPLAWISLFFAVAFSMPADCAPLPPPDGGDPAHERHCAQTTPAETAAFAAWAGVTGLTVLLLITALTAARRSRTVAWAAVPCVLANSLIAYDLGHAAGAVLR